MQIDIILNSSLNEMAKYCISTIDYFQVEIGLKLVSNGFPDFTLALDIQNSRGPVNSHSNMIFTVKLPGFLKQSDHWIRFHSSITQTQASNRIDEVLVACVFVADIGCAQGMSLLDMHRSHGGPL